MPAWTCHVAGRRSQHPGRAGPKSLLGEGSRLGGVRVSDSEQAFITEVTEAADKA
jgi:hypothetical protein